MIRLLRILLPIISMGLSACGVFTYLGSFPLMGVSYLNQEEICTKHTYGTLKFATAYQYKGKLWARFNVPLYNTSTKFQEQIEGQVYGTFNDSETEEPQRSVEIMEGSKNEEKDAINSFENAQRNGVRVPVLTSQRWNELVANFSRELFRLDRKLDVNSKTCLEIKTENRYYLGCRPNPNHPVTWTASNSPSLDALVSSEHFDLAINKTISFSMETLPYLKEQVSINPAIDYLFVDSCTHFGEKENCFFRVNTKNGKINYLRNTKLENLTQCGQHQKEGGYIQLLNVVAAPFLAAGFILDAATFPIQVQLDTLCGDNGCGKNSPTNW